MRGPGGTMDLRAGARLLRAITRTGVALCAPAAGVALFGPLGAVVGGLVGAGFIVLVGGGLLTTAPFVRWLGIGLLVLGTAGFLGLRGLARAAGRDV